MFEMGVSNTMIATRGLEEALVARSGPCPFPPDAWRRFLWYYDESIHLEHAIRHGQIYPNKSDLLYSAFIRFDTQIAASTTWSSKPRDALRADACESRPAKGYYWNNFSQDWRRSISEVLGIWLSSAWRSSYSLRPGLTRPFRATMWHSETLCHSAAISMILIMIL
jgi:hypothetical protein